MEMHEARYWLASTARQLDFSAASGRTPLEIGGRPMTATETSAWAATTAEAIREILRAAGLSDDWHLNPDAADADSTNSAH